jgi:ferredoxin--NADP+ reductase
MAHVVTDACGKCGTCLDSCPSDAIHPRPDEADYDAALQVFIDMRACMDCGACALACPCGAIFPAGWLPRGQADAARLNYVHFLEDE